VMIIDKTVMTLVSFYQSWAQLLNERVFVHLDRVLFHMMPDMVRRWFIVISLIRVRITSDWLGISVCRPLVHSMGTNSRHQLRRPHESFHDFEDQGSAFGSFLMISDWWSTRDRVIRRAYWNSE
jgi:hypothetical protein